MGSASRAVLLGATALVSVCASDPASAQQPATPAQPNILFIMGDDIGWMQPSIYHEGLAVGETPNIDRIGHEGAKFMTYYAEQSCTAGRTAFITGMQPLRVGMVLPEIPGSPSYLRTGTPRSRSSCSISATRPASSARTISAIHTESLPTAHGFQEFWGYLYHLDAMQQVSFPDINKSPTEQTSRHLARTRRSRAWLRSLAPSTQDNNVPDAPASGAVVQVVRRHGRRTRTATTKAR